MWRGGVCQTSCWRRIQRYQSQITRIYSISDVKLTPTISRLAVNKWHSRGIIDFSFLPSSFISVFSDQSGLGSLVSLKRPITWRVQVCNSPPKSQQQSGHLVSDAGPSLAAKKMQKTCDCGGKFTSAAFKSLWSCLFCSPWKHYFHFLLCAKKEARPINMYLLWAPARSRPGVFNTASGDRAYRGPAQRRNRGGIKKEKDEEELKESGSDPCVWEV